MRKIKIIGDNYFGFYRQIREASRGVVIDCNNILVSFERKNEQYMLPGGGLEKHESLKDCCVREVQEETGYIVEVKKHVLDIEEYYEDCRYITHYFLCEVKGKTNTNLTDTEKEEGLVPRWVPSLNLLDRFSKHETYRDTNEERRGMYLREYTALISILGFDYGK